MRLSCGFLQIGEVNKNLPILQGYIVDRYPTLRQWRFTFVNFNKNLLVTPTFVKRRKLICTPDTFCQKLYQTKILDLIVLLYLSDCGLRNSFTVLYLSIPLLRKQDLTESNPISVVLIACDLQCVGDHYYVGELACLCPLISVDFLPDSLSCCPVGYSRSLLCRKALLYSIKAKKRKHRNVFSSDMRLIRADVSFFTLLTQCKWCNMVGIETTNFDANSRVIWDVSLSTITFSLSLFTLGWGLLRCSFSRVKSPEWNFANQNDTVLLLVEPSPNTLLILRAVSDALFPQRNSYSKIAQIFDLSMVSKNIFHRMLFKNLVDENRTLSRIQWFLRSPITNLSSHFPNSKWWTQDGVKYSGIPSVFMRAQV